METDNHKSGFSSYARYGLALHAVVLTLFILYLGRILFIPLIFALLIAILLYPLCRFLEKRISRGLAALVSVLLFLTVAVLIITFLMKEIFLFVKDLPKTQDKLIQLSEDARSWLFHKLHIGASEKMVSMKSSFDNLFHHFLSTIGTTLLGAIEYVVSFVFFLIFTYFILVNRNMLLRFILAFFKASQKQKVNQVVDKTRHVIVGYVVGLLIEMAIMFALLIGVFLVLGVKYALLIAAIAALLNIIPYIGIYIATAFGMLLTVTNSSPTLALGVGITFLAVHFIDATFIMLKIVSGRVKINPLITLIAVIAGNLVWGVPGMFLFIPITAIIRIISENVDDLHPWAILTGPGKEISKRNN